MRVKRARTREPRVGRRDERERQSERASERDDEIEREKGMMKRESENDSVGSSGGQSVSDTGARKMPAPGCVVRESGAPRKNRADRKNHRYREYCVYGDLQSFRVPRRGSVTVTTKANAIVAVVTVIALIFVPAVTPEKIPIGAIFEQGTDEVQSAFKFAMLNHNENVTGRRFELQAFVNVINTADAFKLSHLICNQFGRGVYSMLGAVSPDSFDTLHSYSNTFQMPFVTPWFPEKVLTPSSGFLDFAISMRPDYHRAIIDTVRYYGWKKIIYLYDSHDGTIVMMDNGLHDGWATPSVPKLQEVGADSIYVTEFQGAWVINAMYIGIAIGPIMALYLMEAIGRKWTMISSAIPKLASWLMIAFAPSVTYLYIARCLAGIGTGITLTVVPLYVGEVAAKSTRGPMSTTIAVMINFGTLIVYAIGLWVSRLTLALICITIPVVFLLLFIWMPESPVYLVKMQRITDAEIVLKWSLATDDIQEELEEIKRYINKESESTKMSYVELIREMYTRRGNRKAYRIIFILFGGLLLSGTIPVLAYQAYIFEVAEFELDTNISVITIGVFLLLSGWICVSVVKFLGKRKLLLISAPGTAISLMLIAIFASLKNNGVDIASINWLPMASMIAYVLFYAIGLDSMAYAYQGEIFQDNIKPFAGMICCFYYAILSILSLQLFQVLYSYGGLAIALWPFIICTLIIWLVIYLIIPETEGKSLNQIQRELHEEKTTKEIISRATSYIFQITN